MLKLKSIYFLLIFLFGVTASVSAIESQRIFIDGINQYNSGNYEKAVKAFEKITEQGVKNGKLFYNLGNAHFKAGNIGKSIVWYERSLKLIPNDPDLTFNYNYVKGFVKDKSDESGVSIVKIMFFWKELIGKKNIKWFAVFFFLLFWVLVTIQIVKNRKVIKIHTGLVFTLSMIFILTASYDYYVESYIKKAVIIPEKVSVRSGLTNDSTELFILHVGTTVFVEENRKEHVKIRFSGDKIGWINKEKIEVI